jgi:hypothetical protein
MTDLSTDLETLAAWAKERNLKREEIISAAVRPWGAAEVFIVMSAAARLYPGKRLEYDADSYPRLIDGGVQVTVDVVKATTAEVTL